MTISSKYSVILFLLVTVSLGCSAYAQVENNAWLRLTLGYLINERINTDIEYQHRRQNGVGSRSPLKHGLMHSLRNWTGYRFNNGLKLSVSPLGYFRHYRVVEHDGVFSTKPNTEVRFSPALLWQKDLGRGFQFVNRGAGEYRILSNRSDHVVRMRDRVGIRYGVVDRFSVMVYNELLVNVAGVGSGHFVDHNRIGAQLEYELKPQCMLRVGYLYIDRLPLHGETWLHENNMSLNFTYNLQRRNKRGIL